MSCEKQREGASEFAENGRQTTKVLAQRVGAGFQDVWLECVIPHALVNMHVSRVIGKIQHAVAEPPASELQDATNALTSTLRIEAPESIPAPSKMLEIVQGRELAQSANTHHAPDQAASDEPNISRDSPDRVDEAQQQVLEDEGGVHCEEAQYVRDVASNQIKRRTRASAVRPKFVFLYIPTIDCLAG